MYIALVRRHIEYAYACAVWETPVTSDIQKTEMVHSCFKILSVSLYAILLSQLDVRPPQLDLV